MLLLYPEHSAADMIFIYYMSRAHFYAVLYFVVIFSRQRLLFIMKYNNM